MGLKFLNCILLVSILVIGCTRPQQDVFQEKPIEAPDFVRVKPDSLTRPKVISETSSNGVSTDSGTASGPQLSYTEEPSNYFEDAQIIYDFAQEHQLRNVRLKLRSDMISLYKGGRHTSGVLFSQSPFAELFIAQAKPKFLEATKDLENLFEQQKQIILNTLSRVNSELVLPPAPISLSSGISYIAHFLSRFETYARADKTLHDELKLGLYKGLSEKFWVKLPLAQQQIAKYQGTPQLHEAIQNLLQFMSTFEVAVDADDSAKLAEATELGQVLNRELTAQETLSMLVDLWETLPPAEREANFGAVSPELHEYLSKSSEQKRDCLKSPNCKKLFTRLAKQLFILPAIKKHGIEKIQSAIQSAAFQELQAAIHDSILASIRNLPSRIYNEVSAELDREQAKYMNIRNNFDDFARRELQQWFEVTYGRRTIPALEDSSLDMAAKLRLRKRSSSMTFQPKVFGDALAASEILFNVNDSHSRLLAWTRVNQLLANGGFSKANGNSFPTLARAVGRKQSFLNVERGVLSDSVLGYFTGANLSGFSAESSRIRPSMTNADYVSLLRGFRKLINVFADWKPSPWSRLTQPLNVADMLSSLDHKDLNQQPLPQDAMLGLAVANYTSYLAGLGSKGSPLFFMCRDGSLAWIAQGQKCSQRTTLVTLGADKTSTVVRTLDHARFLHEILDFVAMIDELEKTKSKYIKNRRGGSQSGIAQLKAAKPKLRDLVLGLSNFLSNVLLTQEGQFIESFDVKKRKAVNDRISLEASLEAIRALIRSSDFFGIEIYRTSARGAFYTLNHMYDPDKGFYRVANGEPSLRSRILAIDTLNALVKIEPDEDTKNQMKELKAQWQRSVQRQLQRSL